jgi:hypothetical protein
MYPNTASVSEPRQSPRRQDLRGQHDILVDAEAGAPPLPIGDGDDGLRRATAATAWPRPSNRPI